MSAVILEAAKQEDKAAMAELWRECGLVASYNDPGEDFDFARGKLNSDVLVMRSEEAILASVMVGHDGHRGWLYYVSVSPSAQKAGLGTKIVGAGEAWLRERGVRKVMLLVRETNVGVKSFYNQLDYEEAPRVVMQKWL